MLNKIKIIAIVGVALQLIRSIFPAFDIGADFEGSIKGMIDSLYIIIPVLAGWLKKESQANVDALVTNG